MKAPRYKFYPQTEKIDELIIARHDPLKEWRPDLKGYFLIRVNRTKKVMEVGYCTYDHIIRKKIVGGNAIEIYNTICKRGLLSRLEHAAYLGKELYKAEVALKYGLPYRQEFPLELPVKVKVKLKKES